MQMRRMQVLVCSVLVFSSVVLGTCSNISSTSKKSSKPAEVSTPFGKYEEEITQTSVRIKTSWMTLDEGEDENNNVWTRYLKDKLNIKLTQIWTAPNWGKPFDEKINIAITTDNLPDNIPVYTTLFYRIANSGKAADLSEIYDEYASDNLKRMLQLQEGVAIKSATIDGKLYGIGSPQENWPRGFLWIRKDWLDKLNLQAPKTLDELYEVARAFATEDPNGNGKKDEIGIQLNKDFFSGTSDVKYLFAAYNLYPNLWVDKDGKLERGDIQPEIKVVLNKLAELYKEKIIDQEFAVKDTNYEGINDIASGRVGMIFNTEKASARGEIEASVKMTGAQWEAYDMPTIDGKLLKSPYGSRVANFTVSSYKNKHPEAVIKMINLQLETASANPEFVTDNSLNMSPTGKMNFWCAPSNIADPTYNLINYINVLDALKSGDDTKLNFIEKETFDMVMENRKDSAKYWGTAQFLKPGGAMEQTLEKYKDAVFLTPAWGPETRTWMESGQNLTLKCAEFYIKAVMSGEVDKEFDNWINYFNSQGGSVATEEINQWYNKYK
jgi:putative aldouronate transport system substrate-binding protein